MSIEMIVFCCRARPTINRRAHATTRARRRARIVSLKMPKQEISSPQELWNNLLDISPNRFNGGYPDIDMLRGSYLRFSEREESKVAKLSFQKALVAWSDGQRREFVYLFTESQEVSSIPSEDIRKLMMKLYKKIFETEVQSQ